MQKRTTSLFALIPTLFIGGATQSVHADWDLNFGGISAADPQDIVVSLATDPKDDPEAACLAVTFARNLSGNPNANVTLFVTLDGVHLANKAYISSKKSDEEYSSKRKKKHGHGHGHWGEYSSERTKKHGEEHSSAEHAEEYKCTTPWGEFSLAEHLTTYIDHNDNKMVVCPLCWNERYEGELPDFGVLPGAEDIPGTAIGMMMFNADKILSF